MRNGLQTKILPSNHHQNRKDMIVGEQRIVSSTMWTFPHASQAIRQDQVHSTCKPTIEYDIYHREEVRLKGKRPAISNRLLCTEII